MQSGQMPQDREKESLEKSHSKVEREESEEQDPKNAEHDNIV